MEMLSHSDWNAIKSIIIGVWGITNSQKSVSVWRLLKNQQESSDNILHQVLKKQYKSA